LFLRRSGWQIFKNSYTDSAGQILVQKICFSIPGVYRKFEFHQSLATIPCTRVYEEPLAENWSKKNAASAGLTEVELTDRKVAQLLSRG
jgi:hypothetical protein